MVAWPKPAPAAIKGRCYSMGSRNPFGTPACHSCRRVNAASRHTIGDLEICRRSGTPENVIHARSPLTFQHRDARPG